jgi:hypothetical protein
VSASIRGASQQASIALADGFGDNTWRELTRLAVVAAQCPSVTKYVTPTGRQQGDSDINSLVAQGITRSWTSRTRQGHAAS